MDFDEPTDTDINIWIVDGNMWVPFATFDINSNITIGSCGLIEVYWA